MTREENIKVLKQNCANKNLFKHMLATEAVMAGLAERRGFAHRVFASRVVVSKVPRRSQYQRRVWARHREALERH